MEKEFLKMQKLAGIITESQYKEKLNEDEEINSFQELSKENSIEVEYGGKLHTGYLSKNNKYVFFTIKEDSAGIDYRPDKFFVMRGHKPEKNVNGVFEIKGGAGRMGEIYDTEKDALNGAYEASIEN
jgi:hypothetical protein